SNPRREAPVLNARIRKRWLASGLPLGLVGPEADLTYPAQHLGAEASALRGLLDGSHPFAEAISRAKKPMVILGEHATARPDGAAVLAAAWALADKAGALRPDWHGFNLLHSAAARVGALDLGFVPAPHAKGLAQMMGGGVDVLWLLGADEFDVRRRVGPDTFVIYQGHHGDRGAARADVILPGAAYTEKHGTYVNTEGRVQRGAFSVYPPGQAREDWRIVRAVSELVGRTLPYDDIDTLRQRLEQVNPVFGRLDFLPRFGCSDTTGPAGDPDGLSDTPFSPPFESYYQTDPISRASPTMAECSATFAPPRLAAAE
ncbi:MAG: molybdopterin-dependent oxidoreductase, partial [Acetobacteraceae bacterium]